MIWLPSSKKRGYQQIVLTYSPLTTKVSYQPTETSKLLIIRRFYLPGHNLFHQLEKFPLFNFLYITPVLLINSIIWLISNQHRIDVIHSHGLNAAIIGNLLKPIFRISRHITSIYSTYDNVPFNSLSTRLLVACLNRTNHILTQTNQSIQQLITLGVNKENISRYYHWIDIHRFKPVSQKKSPFSILFIGRMIPSKNAILLATVARKLPQIIFNFIGTGPQYPLLQTLSKKYPNIVLLGDIPYIELHRYYQSNSLLCLPSLNQEGWGRVLAESVACGTPVICSDRGGTIEAIDTTVAIIINPTVNNFYKSIKSLFESQHQLQNLQSHCRPYALKHYSSDNISYITRHY